MNSSGDITMCEVPSRQGAFSLSANGPAALHGTRSLASAGRVMQRKICSSRWRSWAPRRKAACRLKPCTSARGIVPCTAEFAARSIAPTATVVSDGRWCFWGVTLAGADHDPVATGGGKASATLPRFKAGNTVLGNLKTALSSTYHTFAFVKYAHRDLAKAQYHFNRRFDTQCSMSSTCVPRSARCCRWPAPNPIRATAACSASL